MLTLVTGLQGFVGSELAQAIPCVPLALPDGESVDIRDLDAVRRAVGAIGPERVIHLAAQTFVPASFENPRATFDTNFYGTLNLLQALKEIAFTGRMLFVSSGDIYGLVPEEELPVSEARVPRPRNPYAVSKVAAEALCHQWSQTEGFDIVTARPFNHVGPGQDERFVVATIARQVAQQARSGDPFSLMLGDIDATRDYTDVRDIVAAYLAILTRGANAEIYNVCSGVERSVRDIARDMADLLGREAVFNTDPARLRPSDQRRMVGDGSKIRTELGWIPEIAWKHTLQAILDEALETS
jgi:GDP-4-dehydro-6-deoxy-D-mannose reductase